MNDKLEKLDLLSDVLQIVNFYLLMKDANNNQIMKALQDQNTKYFERIVKDLDLIKQKIGV